MRYSQLKTEMKKKRTTVSNKVASTELAAMLETSHVVAHWD